MQYSLHFAFIASLMRESLNVAHKIVMSNFIGTYTRFGIAELLTFVTAIATLSTFVTDVLKCHAFINTP